MKIAAILLGGAVLILLGLIFLAPGTEYPEKDTRDLDRAELFRFTEQLLEDSEAWPTELAADGVEVASSLDVNPVRTVRYSVLVDAPLEAGRRVIETDDSTGRHDQFLAAADQRRLGRHPYVIPNNN